MESHLANDVKMIVCFAQREVERKQNTSNYLKGESFITFVSIEQEQSSLPCVKTGADIISC
jgi:hypothetical protein